MGWRRERFDGSAIPSSSLLDAACFVCLGAHSLAAGARPGTPRWFLDLLGLIPILISLLALVGYACGVPTFYGWSVAAPTDALALQSAGMLTLLGIGVLCARGETGLAALVASPTSGGVVARRLLLAPVVIPLVTGLITGFARRHGYFHPELAGWLLSFANIFVFTVALWWVSVRLDRAEKTRIDAEHEVRAVNSELEARVLNRTAELKEARDSLKRSEAFLAKAQRIAHLGSWQLDGVSGGNLDSGTLIWSDETFRILGFHPGEVTPTQKLFYSRVHPDDRARVRETLSRSLRDRQPYCCEHRIQLENGTLRHVIELAEIERFDTNGTATRILGTIQDTTETRRLEEALRSRERRFRALLEKSGDSISVVGTDGRFQYLSPAVERVEGYTPEESIGQCAHDRVHPEDLDGLKQRWDQILANPGCSIPIQWRSRHKAGHWLWLEGLSTNLLADPAVGGVVTNYRDITERKAAEQKLLAQLSRMDLLHGITRAVAERQDLVSIFQVVLRALESDFPTDFGCIGLLDDARESLVVRCISTRLGSLEEFQDLRIADRIGVHANGLSHCMRGQLVFNPDLHALAFDFAKRLARAGLGSLVAAPLAVEGRVLGVLLVARVATQGFSNAECEFLNQLSSHVSLAVRQTHLYGEMQKAYEHLRQTQQAMMQQERLRALGQMASGIAHDINNAISPLTLYTETLIDSEPDLSQEGKEYLEIIKRAVFDVAATVERLREFYRQPEAQTKFLQVSLNSMVRQVAELTRARWEDLPQQRGIVIGLETDLTEPAPTIEGVESEIREALINLIFNAVDAMPTGGTLTLRTRTLPPTPSRTSGAAAVEVHDTGIGMDEETRKRCFEPFFTTKGERGTGLGLAMVYGMVQRHGAEIEIDTAPGHGTCFRLCFPIPTQKAAPVPPTPASNPRELPPLHILLVDDDRLVAKSVCTALATDNHIVEIADGGQAGIDAFLASLQPGNRRFDVLFTDLGMPHVDGRHVAAAVKAASPSTPVILLTGWGQRLSDEEGALPHVDIVLSKPTVLRELRDALKKCFPDRLKSSLT